MFRYRNNETYVAVWRKGRVGFQQHTAYADVVTDCVNPRNGVARSKLYLNGITYRETTVPTLRLKRWAGDVFGFSHTFVPSAWPTRILADRLAPHQSTKGHSSRGHRLGFSSKIWRSKTD